MRVELDFVNCLKMVQNIKRNKDDLPHCRCVLGCIWGEGAPNTPAERIRIQRRGKSSFFLYFGPFSSNLRVKLSYSLISLPKQLGRMWDWGSLILRRLEVVPENQARKKEFVSLRCNILSFFLWFFFFWGGEGREGGALRGSGRGRGEGEAQVDGARKKCCKHPDLHSWLIWFSRALGSR